MRSTSKSLPARATAKCLLSIALLFGFLYLPPKLMFAKSSPLRVTLAQLLRNPQKFDGHFITVEGFLDIEQKKTDGTVGAFLFLNRNDAQYSPPINSIIVVPTKSMLRQKTRIDRQFVAVSGLFRSAPTASGGSISVVSNIQSCVTIIRKD